MQKILDFISCAIIVLLELIIILAIAVLIQTIFYRVFGINIYKNLKKKLIK